MKYIFLLLSMSFYFAAISQQTVGIFINEEEAVNGYTLWTNGNDTHLIDNCGEEVHRWQSAYKPGLGVYLLENGNLLRCGRRSGSFNGGGGGGQFEMFSWEGATLWSYEFSNEEMQSHHDIAPMPNGNFLALAWTPMSADEASAAGRVYNQDIWIEKIFEIKPLGVDSIEIVWEWSMADHLIQDQFPDRPNYGIVADNPGKMDFNFIPAGQNVDEDWAHFNAIDYNPELDQIVVSSRDFSEIWILDHSTTSEEAMTSSGGKSGMGGDILYRYGNPQVYDRGTPDDQVLFFQHNVEWIDEGLPNEGSLTVFNNQWMTNQSRIERWTPPLNGFIYDIEDGQSYGPTESDWTYDAPEFYSPRISGAQVLQNGNVLICSGGKGRFFEVTEAGEIVWEYINPITSSLGPIVQGENPVQNAVFRALKYSPDYPAFEDKNLIPMGVLELDPLPSICTITGLANHDFDEFSFSILQTVVSHSLVLESSVSIDIQIYDINGYVAGNCDIVRGNNDIDISDLRSGMYFLSDGKKTVKFVKL